MSEVVFVRNSKTIHAVMDNMEITIWKDGIVNIEVFVEGKTIEAWSNVGELSRVIGEAFLFMGEKNTK